MSRKHIKNNIILHSRASVRPEDLRLNPSERRPATPPLIQSKTYRLVNISHHLESDKLENNPRTLNVR